MQQTQRFLVASLAVILLMAVGVSVFADYSAQTISKEFAGMNGGRGYVYDTSQNEGYLSPLPTRGFDLVVNPTGLDAFYNNRFWSIDLSADGTCDGIYWGKLSPYPFTDSYDGFSKTNEGVYLTLGAAYLYKQYATGAFPNAYIDIYDHKYLEDAIRAAMKIIVNDPYQVDIMYYYVNYDWDSNPYTRALLAENSDKNYWLARYDNTWRYDEIGDYCVFVMNLDAASSTYSIPKGDGLYIAEGSEFRNTDQPGVPEPAMLLLWTLGGLGLAGSSWGRSCRTKKIA